MNKLQKTLAFLVASIPLLGCSSNSDPNHPNTTTHGMVELSNGLDIYGEIETYKSENGKKLTRVTKDLGNHRVVVYDDGSRVWAELTSHYGGREIREGSRLTYSYGGEKFPIWRPYAFRNSKAYQDTAKMLGEQLKKDSQE